MLQIVNGGGNMKIEDLNAIFKEVDDSKKQVVRTMFDDFIYELLEGYVFFLTLVNPRHKLIDMYKDTYYDTGSVYVEGQRIKSWKK